MLRRKNEMLEKAKPRKVNKMAYKDKKKADEIFSLFGSLGVEDRKEVIKELMLRGPKDSSSNREGGIMDIKL